MSTGTRSVKVKNNEDPLATTENVKQRVIGQERKPTLDGILLKCTKARWEYRNNEDQQWQSFNERDSMFLETRYRLDNDIPLDEADNSILKGAYPVLKEERELSSEDNEKKIELNDMHKGNSDNTTVRFGFLDIEFREIRRGIYFPANNQPIGSVEAEKIQENLEMSDLPSDSQNDSSVKPLESITNSTPVSNKKNDNNANTPRELATGNNAPIAETATKTLSRNETKDETKEQAAREKVGLGFTEVVSESFDVGEGFLVDDIQAEATSEEDAPTIAKAADSEVYPEIPFGGKLPTEVDNLRCAEVRWLYENKQGHLIPFSDRDSMKTEIKYRLNKGIHLDQEADDIFKTMRDRDAIAGSTYSESGSVEKTKSTDSSDDEKHPVFVGDGYYRVCKKNEWIHPVYWKNDDKKIVRGYYFTEDSKPIEEEEVKAINLNLERHFKKENNPDAEITYSKEIPVGQTIIKFNSLVDITIQREGKNPKSVVRYSKEARWSGEEVEVEQLVFVVHGVWNDGEEQWIVDNAKLLIEGVKDHPDKATGIMFLPIHWRTDLENGEQHKCDKKCSKESYDGKLNMIDKDLKLYHCGFYGDKIRKRVINEVNTLFQKFKSNNPNFKGKVSFFGHSLGSVICYDILTMESLESHRNEFEFKKVEKLFAVGSPLWFFIGKGGENAQKKFRKALKSYRIFNIYHPTDLVASPLEPVILNPQPEIAIQLPAAQDSQKQAFGSFLSSFASQFKNLAHWFVRKPPADKTDFELPHPIDHVLQTVGPLSAANLTLFTGSIQVFSILSSLSSPKIAIHISCRCNIPNSPTAANYFCYLY